MLLDPSSGPCDGDVTILLREFPEDTLVPIEIAVPHSGRTIALIAEILVGSDGAGASTARLGSAGCEVAALNDREFPEDEDIITLFAGHDPNRRAILSRAQYTYTTSVAAGASFAVTPTANGANSSRSLPSTGTSRTAPSGEFALIAVAVAVSGFFLLGAASQLTRDSLFPRRQR
jgi:hypothetical protein